ncbi:MAG: pilus assembly protein N-terminal domain-containing protein [Caulobacteraceae bacterium]
MRGLALAFALALLPASALAASLGVPLNEAAVIALPAPARNVVLGNPSIADVSVADQRHLIVTGKSMGVTNLVVTGDGGRPIFDKQIVVGGAPADRVELIKGGQVESYACAPGCQPVGADGQAPPAAPQVGGYPAGQAGAQPLRP